MDIFGEVLDELTNYLFKIKMVKKMSSRTADRTEIVKEVVEKNDSSEKETFSDLL